jgi:hypothetical protein
MRWLVRFLVWATVLAPPFWLLGDAYHHLLTTASLAVLGIPVGEVRFPPPEIPASHVLGVFAALCLASTRAPLRQRLLALSIGLAGMVVLELSTGVLAIHAQLSSAAAGAPPGPMDRMWDRLEGLPAWIGAPVLWLLLLGRWELPRAPRHPAHARVR